MKYAMNGLLGLVTLGCLLFGGMKLIGAEEMLKNMGNLNYPEWFTRLLGLGEILLGLLLWVPKFRDEAVLILFGIFAGAIGSHLGHGDIFSSVFPAMLFLILTLSVYLIHNRILKTV